MLAEAETVITYKQVIWSEGLINSIQKYFFFNPKGKLNVFVAHCVATTIHNEESQLYKSYMKRIKQMSLFMHSYMKEENVSELKYGGFHHIVCMFYCWQVWKTE
ncbi:hypothetical protein CHARACLAT_019848 [Characodon lateralis]|uniref:Uncharacterized protein n=1 Tax=Characodon lateralis TaxID=208331 RepID=A0ABU7DSL8_9TELE|nr:hypothetical protein [Characodon lateralis]